MRHSIVLAAALAIVVPGFAGGASAQGRDAGDRALGSELARDRAETRIDRLRQDQRQKEDRAQPRAQKLPPAPKTQQQPR